MLRMGSSGGRRRAETVEKSPSPLLILGGILGGALLGAVAWYYLVNAAIDFGEEAKGGRGAAWIFMAMATIGAIACLLLVMVLAARGLGLLGIAKGKPSAHAHAGGHAAAGGHKRASHK